jgi:hypothetical protein
MKKTAPMMKSLELSTRAKRFRRTLRISEKIVRKRG